MLKICALLLTILSVAPAGPARAAGDSPRDPEPVRVIVLGSYHFANPGQDLNNAEADNVLSPRRQTELRALTETLLAFEPTVVAVERTAPPPYEDPVWAEFDEEMLASVRNERVQIGYRLAAAAGIDRVYAVDEQPADGEPDYFPYGPLATFAEAQGESEALGKITNAAPFIEKFQAAQPTQSVPELLMIWNGPDHSDDFYWDVLAFGEGEAQPGPELAAFWFLRNAKIFNKLAQVTLPGDRVVLVFGAGHGHWLREIITRVEGYELEPVMPYLARAAHALAERRP